MSDKHELVGLVPSGLPMWRMDVTFFFYGLFDGDRYSIHAQTGKQLSHASIMFIANVSLQHPSLDYATIINDMNGG